MDTFANNGFPRDENLARLLLVTHHIPDISLYRDDFLKYIFFELRKGGEEDRCCKRHNPSFRGLFVNDLGIYPWEPLSSS